MLPVRPHLARPTPSSGVNTLENLFGPGKHEKHINPRLGQRKDHASSRGLHVLAYRTWSTSLTSPSADQCWTNIHRYVEVQRGYLRNPLPAYPWICPTCHGVRGEGYRLCFRCQSHLTRSAGVLADLVLPISYSPRTWQHHHNLRTYKGTARSEQARRTRQADVRHHPGRASLT